MIAPEGQLVEQLSGDPLERALERGARQGSPTDPAVGSDRCHPRGRQGQAHPGAGARPGQARGRGPADAGGAGRAPCASSAPPARRSSPTAPSSPRRSTTSPRRRTRSTSIRWASCCFEGYDRYRMYFKEALDKLGVDINVFRVGAFKSAVGDLHAHRHVARGSRGEPALPQRAVDDLPGRGRRARASCRRMPWPSTSTRFMQTRAGRAGRCRARWRSQPAWSPASRSQLEVEKRLIELVGEDDDRRLVQQVSGADYVRVVHADKKLQPVGKQTRRRDRGRRRDPRRRAAAGHHRRRVHRAPDPRCAPGRGHQGASCCASTAPAAACSPPSRSTASCVALRAAGKPLVVSMGDLAASGGYYIAAPADEIWASPATITGSIGIFAIIPDRRQDARQGRRQRRRRRHHGAVGPGCASTVR